MGDAIDAYDNMQDELSGGCCYGDLGTGTESDVEAWAWLNAKMVKGKKYDYNDWPHPAITGNLSTQDGWDMVHSTITTVTTTTPAVRRPPIIMSTGHGILIIP